MSYGRYLRELLAPLRLYDLEAPFNGGELNVQGGALDGVDTWLAELRRESTLAEAESWGLERIIALLARRPVADTPTGMRKALAALMRIGGDSFTLEAINATISGCGVHAHVEEKEIPGEVAVSFPDIPGIPKGFKEIREIIEDILPAHLGIEYVFWYITWEELERKISCWAEIEERQLTWEQLETLVGYPSEGIFQAGPAITINGGPKLLAFCFLSKEPRGLSDLIDKLVQRVRDAEDLVGGLMKKVQEKIEETIDP